MDEAKTIRSSNNTDLNMENNPHPMMASLNEVTEQNTADANNVRGNDPQALSDSPHQPGEALSSAYSSGHGSISESNENSPPNLQRRRHSSKSMPCSMRTRNRSSTSESDSLLSGSHHHLGTVDSSIACSGFTTPELTCEEHPTLSPEAVTERLLFKRVIQQCNAPMKVHGPKAFATAAADLFKNDHEIQQMWRETMDFYKTSPLCRSANRSFESDLVACLNALVGDERELMIGLDATSSLKDVLITCMRLVREPAFVLEIRIGLGGTVDPLNLRTPAYAIAGINRLQQLLALREQFSVPATPNAAQEHLLLSNPPVLNFFSAWTAAVRVNNQDQAVGQQRARDMLTYIKSYINNYHPSLESYVGYEMDHADTYKEQLLTDVTELFVKKSAGTKIMDDLLKQGQSHGSNADGCINYASMHIIMFKDVIHKENLRSLFAPLDHDTHNDVSKPVPDCIISIGGSVEKRFGEVRQSVREAFRDAPHPNSDLYHHPALSVRMLSRAGQTPVYYQHQTHEITVDAILNGRQTQLHQSDRAAKAVNEDVDIIKEDIGVSVLQPIFRHASFIPIPHISLWKRMVTNLIDKILDTWRVHARGNLTCGCSTQGTTAIDQFLTHWHIWDEFHLNTDGCSIIRRIIRVLEEEFHCSFGQSCTSRRNSGLCANKDVSKTIIDELGHELDRILIEFVQTEFS